MGQQRDPYMTPIERGTLRAAEQELGRPFTAEEIEMLLPSPLTADALRELVEALREYDAENEAAGGRSRHRRPAC